MFYFVKVCKRANFFTISKQNIFFTSERAMNEYIDFFNSYLFIEDSYWISQHGTAHENKKGMIVADQEESIEE